MGSFKISAAADLSKLTLEYHSLKAEHEKLKGELEKAKNEQGIIIRPHVWGPYLKFTYIWVVTSMILFALAERQMQNGYQIAFGVLSALGGTLFFLAIPATHVIGRWLHQDYKLWQPLEGGIRFIVLQGLSWSFYGLTVLIILFSVMYAEEYHDKGGGLLSGAGVIGILSQVFMVSSLLTFQYDPKKQNIGNSIEEVEKYSISTADNAVKDILFKHKGERAKVRSLIDYKDHHSTEVQQFNKVLAFITEHTEHGLKRYVISVLSLVCMIVGICLTHGIGGLVKHSQSGWRFSQIFIGGTQFVWLQICAWSLFGFVLVIHSLFWFGPLLLGMQQTFEGGMYIGGFAGVASQFLLANALNHFQGPQKTQNKEVKAKVGPTNYRKLETFGYLEGAYATSVVFLLWNTQYVYIFAHLFWLELPHMLPNDALPVLEKWTYGVIPDIYKHDPVITPVDSIISWLSFFGAIVTWVVTYSTTKNFDLPGWITSIVLSVTSVLSVGACLRYHENSPHRPLIIVFSTLNFVYMSTTHTKMPEFNGCREWKDLRNSQFLVPQLSKYFGFKLVLSPRLKEISKEIGSVKAKSELRQVLLGYHPHGIFPATHLLLPASQEWRDQLPNLEVNPVVGSVIHVVPVMRDSAQWLGVCEVSKKAMKNLLSMGRSVQVVIGGQTEMFESRSWDKEIMIVRKKRFGIFKLAIQQGVGIMPTYCFGEPQVMDNVYYPCLQTYMKRLVGFPIPYIPYGRWFLPMPRRVPITVVADAPVFPAKRLKNPSMEDIVDLQTRYFDALEKLFERNKSDCGHSEYTIKWIDE